MTTNYALNQAAGLTQVLQDGTYTFLYGNGWIGQFTASESAYFLGDSLGSVRQLTDESGVVTLSRSYTPYGKTLSSQGSGQTSYGYTGEDGANGVKDLLFLRSRYLSLSDGRFLTKDTWQGNYNRSLSLNQWIYVEDNPINFVDPLGMAKRSYLFYFDGAGNRGNSTIGQVQNDFLDALRIAVNFQVDIVAIFPYGAGLSGEGLVPNVLNAVEPAAYGLDAGVTEAKANQIWNYVFFGKDIADTVLELNNCAIQEPVIRSDVKISLGYSGGGQIAYTTAQRLSGRVFVDNLIMFGSPWRAYNGTNNIGHIWEFWGKGDLDLWYTDLEHSYGGDAYNLTQWREYNEGWRVEYCSIQQAPGLCPQYHKDLDIYRSANVKRVVLGDSTKFNHDSYFKDDIHLPDGKSMRRELIDYIVNTIGIE